MNKYIKYGIIGAAGLLLFKGIKNAKDSVADGKPANFTNAEYKLRAEKIYEKLKSFWGGYLFDDYSGVVSIVKEMQNGTDMQNLIDAYGKRKYGSLFDYSGLSFLVPEKNLKDTFATELTQSAKDKINEHMAKINVGFFAL